MTKILFFLKKMLAIFFGVFFMFMTIGQKVNTFEPLDKENIKLDLTLMSDIHMEGTVFKKFEVIPKCFNSLNGGKKYIDALVINGDNSICAQNIENMFFYGVLNNVNPIRPYYIATGNHDIGNNDEQFGTFEELRERQIGYVQSFVDKNVTELYYSEVVKGYRLILLGPDTPECGNRNLSDKQLDWFEAELDKAAESGLPIFVFNHYPCCVIGEGYDRYISLLNKYDNIFLIVGHAHSAPIFGTVPGEKGTPEVWIPSITSNNDGTTGYGYQMEVYDNTVTFRTYDYYTGTYTGTDMTYTLK
ncbi:MAG: metallophosphoesterase [Clostridia bacterium]|nr:metallophosphoesterase [Clostridia bacterium]